MGELVRRGDRVCDFCDSREEEWEDDDCEDEAIDWAGLGEREDPRFGEGVLKRDNDDSLSIACTVYALNVSELRI